MEIRKYMENLIDTTKKILDRISEFEKTCLLYTSDAADEDCLV